MYSLPVLLMLAAVLFVAVTVLVIILLTQRKRPPLNKSFYARHWSEIDKLLVNGSPESWQMAVINADKLLFHAMRAKGVRGAHMGEVLKNGAPLLSNRNAVWRAHKLRNQLAHENGVRLDLAVARKAVNSFKSGLRDMGAID